MNPLENCCFQDSSRFGQLKLSLINNVYGKSFALYMHEIAKYLILRNKMGTVINSLIVHTLRSRSMET